MTGKGPYGFPRLTSLGPFAEQKASQEFNREIFENNRINQFLDREISSIHGTDINDITEVSAKLIVRENAEEPDENNGPLDKLVKEVKDLASDTTVSRVNYWFDIDSKVGRIIYIETLKDFQGMGVATQLKEQELDFMADQGIEVAYTDIISDGGYGLAKRTGFKPIHKADHLVGTEAALTFQNNRGIMFKCL